MTSRNQESGVTLIEVLLVLAIAVSMLILGLKQYELMQKDTDIRQARQNIDNVFQAAANYYYAQCYGQTNPANGLVSPGTLNPKANPPSPFPITLATLRSGGFLGVPMKVVPFLADVVVPDNNYEVQFNRTTQTRYACQAGTLGSCTAQNSVGTIITWNIQVSVHIRDPLQADMYHTLLGGDCVSVKAGNIVAPCPGVTTGDYVVLQRQPLFASPETASTAVSTNPTLTQFQQMYTTMGIEYLFAVPHSPEYQYYYCGG